MDKNITLTLQNFTKNKHSYRIRSKRFLNMLDLLENEILSYSLYSFSFTVNLSHIKEKKVLLADAWSLVLPDFFSKLNDFIISSNSVCFLASSIEIHKDGFEFLQDFNTKKKFKKTKKNTLAGYPHVHIVCSFSYNPYIHSKKSDFLHTMQAYILNAFIDYDIKIAYLETEKTTYSIKNALKYIFKEYKCPDVGIVFNQVFNIADFSAINFHVSDNWKTMQHFISRLKEIKDFKFNTYLINMIVDLMAKVEDPLHKLKNFVLFYLKTNNLKFYCGNAYSHIENTRTWVCVKSLEALMYELTILFPENMDLIVRNKKKFVDLNIKTFLIDDLSFYDFKYIEFDDCFLDLHKSKLIFKHLNCDDKSYEKIYCFKYFPFKIKDLLGFFSIIELLSNKFYSFKDFLLFLLKFGSILKHGELFKKGNSIYLWGPSNLAKSVITEFFLSLVFGEHNIGILNTKDSKFMLDQIENKHIIILNEFINKKTHRDIYLKLLDGTLLDISVKYESSKKKRINAHTVATSNYSMIAQGFDMAFFTRFTEIQMAGTPVTQEERQKIIEALPLFILCCTQTLSSFESINELKQHMFKVVMNFYHPDDGRYKVLS